MNPLLAKLLGVFALVLAVFFGIQYVRGLGASEQLAKDTVTAQELKIKTDAELLAANNRALAMERRWQDLTDKQNAKDDQNVQVTNSNTGRLHAAESHGRLRDPNATPCPSSESQVAGAPSDRPADPTEGAGLLSVPLTELLERALREADAINVAYASCRAQALDLRTNDTPEVSTEPAQAGTQLSQ